MGNKIEIILEVMNNEGVINIFENGRKINGLMELELFFNQASGKTTFAAKRIKTDNSGVVCGDKDNPELEAMNLLNFLNPHISTIDRVMQERKALDFALLNIYMTSFHNARKLIKERLN